MDPVAADIISHAQDLLSKRFGGTQKLTDVSELAGSGGTIVLRARVANQPFLQERSIVVKYVPETGDVIDDTALLREIVAYQFTTSLAEDVRPGPALLAYDYDERLIVITDSGEGDTFAELLRQKDPEKRQQILRNLGTALGKMHAGTAGKEDGFQVLLNRMLKTRPEARESWDIRERSLASSVEWGIRLIDAAGITVPHDVSELALDAASRLSRSRSQAFTPFDLSPDNIIVAKKTEFLDYEWAGFRDVGFDLACVLAGFPQFVGTLPISDEEGEAFLRAWVSEVVTVWPNADNEDYLHNHILGAMLGWAFSSVAIMHRGSLIMSADDDADETEDLYTPLLREEGPFSDEEVYVRRDLYETFEALARYAVLGRNPVFTVVADFASTVAKRVAKD